MMSWLTEMSCHFGKCGELHLTPSQVINGVSHQGEIAEAFRQVFQSHARPNNMTTNSHLQQKFCALYSSYVGDDLKADSAITVELVDHAVSELKRARAAGPDGVTAEHLLYSHPLIRVLLSLLSQCSTLVRTLL